MKSGLEVLPVDTIRYSILPLYQPRRAAGRTKHDDDVCDNNSLRYSISHEEHREHSSWIFFGAGAGRCSAIDKTPKRTILLKQGFRVERSKSPQQNYGMYSAGPPPTAYHIPTKEKQNLTQIPMHRFPHIGIVVSMLSENTHAQMHT